LLGFEQSSLPDYLFLLLLLTLLEVNEHLLIVLFVVAEFFTPIWIGGVVTLIGSLLVEVFRLGTPAYILLQSDNEDCASDSRFTPVANIRSAARTEWLAYQPRFNALCMKEVLWVARQFDNIAFVQQIRTNDAFLVRLLILNV